MTSIPVLYIGGDGRSGSTLVERMLCQHDSITGIGEASTLWTKGFKRQVRCSCGASVPDCSFWGPVMDRTVDDLSSTKLDYFNQLQANFTTVAGNVVTLRDYAHPEDSSHHRTRFSELIEALYRNMLAVSQTELIVDSSKNLGRALFFHQHPGFDLSVLYLVRDPRGVAYSKKYRPHRLPEYEPPIRMATLSVSRALLHWWVKSLGWEFSRLKIRRFKTMLYENFVQAPPAQCKELFDWLDLTRPTINPRAPYPDQWHSVSGNPLRFEHGDLQISLDDTWKTEMPTLEKLAVSTLASPLLAYYGYELVV